MTHQTKEDRVRAVCLTFINRVKFTWNEVEAAVRAAHLGDAGVEIASRVILSFADDHVILRIGDVVPGAYGPHPAAVSPLFIALCFRRQLKAYNERKKLLEYIDIPQARLELFAQRRYESYRAHLAKCTTPRDVHKLVAALADRLDPNGEDFLSILHDAV